MHYTARMTSSSQSIYLDRKINRKDIPLLHCLKFFAAFLIVMLHTNTIYPIIYAFCDIGVPIFLLVTGYFLPNNEGIITEAKLKRTIVKLLKFIILLQSLYLISYVFLDILTGSSLIVNKLSNGDFWIKLLLFGNQICGPLWYLTAVAEALLIIWLLEKTPLTKFYWVIIAIGLFLNLFINEFRLVWNGYYPPQFPDYQEEVVRNVFITALPFILLGVNLRRNKSKLPGLKLWTIFTLIAIIGLYVEYTLLNQSNLNYYCNLHITTIALAVSLFMISITAILPRDYPKARLLSRHSSNIYFFHILVLNVLSIAIPFLSSIVSTKSIIIFTATLIVSYLFEFIKVICFSNKSRCLSSIQRMTK